MERKTENVKPQSGTWENMQSNIDNTELKPKVEFKVNITQQVLFVDDEPRELPNQEGNGVFYIFDVIHEKQEKVIMTSAWSMLHGLKKLAPLKGKTLDITLLLEKGKQRYEVIDPSQPEEESVKE